MKKLGCFILSTVLITSVSLPLQKVEAVDPEGSSLYINEIMAANTMTIRDGDVEDIKNGAAGGSYSDWIELYNGSNEAVDLTGYTLSDDGATWTFPQSIVPPKGYLIVWASDKNKVAKDGQLHVNFKLSSSGEKIVLKTPDGAVLDSVSFGSLGDDESYGRNTDGGTEFFTFSKSTPNAANANGLVAVDEPIFSHKAGFYTDAFDLTLSVSQKDVKVYYTTNGSDPVPGKSGTFQYLDKINIKSRAGEPNVLSMIKTGDYFWNPPVGEVFKCSIVKAIAVSADGKKSRIVTGTYFVDPNMKTRYELPIISLVTDQVNLFDSMRGIYVNSNRVGDAWERPVHVEFFEKDGTLGFSKYCNMRLHGGGSKGFAQKSLRLYANNEYDGKDKISYNIFHGLTDEVKGESIDSFKRLILRNSGSDWSGSMFRDAMMQSLVSHLKLDTQAYRPSVVFIDGEYWGIHNIRERYDNIYFASHYKLDKDRVALLEVPYTFGSSNKLTVNEGTEEDAEAYTNDITNYLKSNDISSKDAYEYIKTKMDIDNYIDYQVANIYFSNSDWPQNNVTMWKYKTDDGLYHPEAPYGQDGRWRWIIKDLDFGFCGGMAGANGLSHDTLAHSSMMTSTQKNEWAVFLFGTLLKNQEFRNEFINRMADYMNTCFDSSFVNQRIDKMKADLASSMTEHNNRWQAIEDWDGDIGVMKNFANERSGYVINHMISKFGTNGVTGTATIKLDTDIEKGFVRVNSVDINNTTPGVATPESWTGTYFKGVPVKIKAVPQKGYVFDHWEGVEEVSDTITITPTEDMKIKAVFKASSGQEYKISGYINPEVDSKASDFKAQFKVEAVEKQISAMTDEKGYFEISLPSSETSYTLKVSKPGYLLREVKNISASKDNVIFPKEEPLILWAGDSNSDGSVNMSDVIQLAKIFGSVSGDGNYKAEVDFNKDKSVNMQDVIIIAKHFNATSMDY